MRSAMSRGGFTGKARTLRARVRADQRLSEQMLLEYLQSEPTAAPQLRAIPIHGRREFLPSYESPWMSAAAHGETGPSQDAHSGERNPELVSVGRSGEVFTLAGFVAGCAVGAAAAVVLLLAIQSALQ